MFENYVGISHYLKNIDLYFAYLWRKIRENNYFFKLRKKECQVG